MAVSVNLGFSEVKGILLSVHGSSTEVVGRVLVGNKVMIVDMLSVSF